MSTLLSSWSRTVQSVPANYVFPEGKRPGSDIAAPVCNDIPVIDLSQSMDSLDRDEIIQQIVKANQDFGMFQVINHGVLEELLDETMNLFKEFFNMPAKDKAMDVVAAYSVEVKKLSSRILDIICEGLGVEIGYFGDELSKLQQLVVHHYPPCPDPSLVLGVGGHTDPHLLTLLQQDINGLQIFKDGQWLGVKPIPHAFVIMLCDQLEIISNGKLRSAQHRAVTNTSSVRTSLVTFISPSLESIIGPEKALVKASEPQLFKPIQYKEYLDIHVANHPW